MEDTNQTDSKTPTQPPTKRFMDIQGSSAQKQEVSDTQTAPAVTTEADPSNESVPQPKTDQPPIEQASPDMDVAVSSEADSVESVASDQPEAETSSESTETTESTTPSEAPDEPAEAPGSDNQSEHPHTPHGVPVVAVVVAIVVTLALSGLVIYAFMKSKDDAKTTGSTNSTNSQTTVAKPQASPTDVDQTSSEIDESLTTVNEATDFSTTDISDQSLGL